MFNFMIELTPWSKSQIWKNQEKAAFSPTACKLKTFTEAIQQRALGRDICSRGILCVLKALQCSCERHICSGAFKKQSTIT